MEPSETSSTPFALVFTDMVGSTAAKRAASLGENETTRDSNYLEAIQSRHLHLVRDTVATHGGKEIMTIGDSFFLTFDDPNAALLCCAEIQMRLRAQPIMTGNGPLKLRIGMHVGRPKFFENSWHGIAVDTAARAEAVGSPEQIVLTDAARQHLGHFPAIKLTPLGTFALKGVGDVPLWDVDYDQHGPRKPQVPSVETLRRQHRTKLAWRAGYAVLVVLILLGGFLGYRRRQDNKFTEKDKIILADFDNKTGDPVFDATLKEALSIQLEQSPYLQLVGDQELHADLRYLNQPSDQRITPALARELGQREGIKAYITASVANIGASYVVSVDAVNTATGDPIARVQAESPDKTHVLTAISTAAAALRAKLGESLASVQKLSTPFMNVTTSSLDAFHAYALGDAAHSLDNNVQALIYYKQAIDLDPNFAMAYAREGNIYSNLGQTTKSLAALAKAYELREHATERERLYIAATVALDNDDVPGTIQGYQALLAAYPRDPAALNNLGVAYVFIGEFPKAIGYIKQVVDLDKWDDGATDNAALNYLYMDDPTSAKKYIEASAAVTNGNDTTLFVAQMIYAYETNDPSWRNSHLADNLPDGFAFTQILSQLHYLQGSLTEARAVMQQSVSAALQAKAPDVAGNGLSTAAFFEAEYGECAQATSLTKKALTLDTSFQTLPNAALALALCGQGSAELPALQKLAQANSEHPAQRHLRSANRGSHRLRSTPPSAGARPSPTR
jgi:class 3 adenylate cyclase/tetratricopeptide (TPR) repeat protein